ncbi:MAG: carboxypeptidase-like regulatory domain-containing protein [Chitinophagales bacterium]|nr:carboxypeptidase-like regulatory domain-containing protein [Bacteroidota bacterium]MCB9042402.1 carboxypeptidase-like regulatory domain-containing protein [Chitinophagales bacterium]
MKKMYFWEIWLPLSSGVFGHYISGAKCTVNYSLIRLFIIIAIFNNYTIWAQDITGMVVNSANEQAIEFVNIGIVGKNIGTVSDENGHFSLFIDAHLDNDSILFSAIGYAPQWIKIADLRRNSDATIRLEEKVYEFSEVVIKPKTFKKKILGITADIKQIAAGFHDNLLGYECGIMIKVKKTAILKQLNINVSSCTYDSVFYRLNIYEDRGEMGFENILKEPIYIKLLKEEVEDEIQIDLRAKNIVVSGNALITLEHIKNLGEGHLDFCAAFGKKTYFRETSQAKWETVPVGISINVFADVEK